MAKRIRAWLSELFSGSEGSVFDYARIIGRGIGRGIEALSRAAKIISPSDEEKPDDGQ